MVYPKYKKKQVEIEAIQWTGENQDEIRRFLKSSQSNNQKFIQSGSDLLIDTLEGKMRAEINDYIIKGIQGEFYPCKPDIFNQTYEAIN